MTDVIQEVKAAKSSENRLRYNPEVMPDYVQRRDVAVRVYAFELQVIMVENEEFQN